MDKEKQFLNWARELQALAQAGLFYTKDPFDEERFARVREIALEMMEGLSDLPKEKLRGLFLNETGYQTPKIDSRAAVIERGQILLVKERDGLWALPGGWVDAHLSVGENALKELKEEAGIDGEILRLIAVQDREKHNPGPSAYGIMKVFILCRALKGDFVPNHETLERGYFPLDALPPLAVVKTTREQIELCFRAAQSEAWVAQVD